MDQKRRRGNDFDGRRRHISCFNVVITCVILIAANSLAGGHFTNRINRISLDLRRSLDAALDIKMTNYTSIYENITYVSLISINPRGMTGLYNITTSFIDLISPKNIYPEGVVKVENGNLKLGSLEEQWESVAAHYGAILAIVILLLLFAILMPICGLCFCCCRCYGKCGARSKPFDKKGDLCKKICLASLLICVGTLLLFGIVCAFVTNQALHDHTYELMPSINNGVKDTDSYLMYTGRQLNVLSHINYKEFQRDLFDTLNKCSDMVSDELEEYTNASSLNEIINIVNNFEHVKNNLTFIAESLNILRTDASQLNDGLRKVKADLLVILKDCGRIPGCGDLYDKYIAQLNTEIDFDKMKDLEEPIKMLEGILDGEIVEKITLGQQKLDEIRDEINKTVANQLPAIRQSITEVGNDISKYGADISAVITRTRDTVHKYADAPLASMEKYLKEYMPYRYYLGIAISCILLVISLCITLGLICGICGKRPDAYGDDCCNKGAGSRFLMLGVAIMFVFSIVLATVAIVYFFTGVLAQKLICDTLRNPNESQVIHLLDEVVNLKDNVEVDANISSVLVSIHNNKSIYHTLHLKKYFDLEDIDTYIQELNIDQIFADIKKTIKDVDVSIELIDDGVKEQLEQVIESEFDKILDSYIEEYNHNLTTVSLSFLAEKLEDIVKYPVVPKHMASSLMLSSLHLRTYQDNLVTRMTTRFTQMIDSIKVVQDSFSSSSIKKLLDDIEYAQNELEQNGTDILLQLVDDFAEGLKKHVFGYLDRVVLHIKDDLGVTEPISRAYNASLAATCDKIILPWNGFWFSILWCLLLFIPAIILSVKLASLYQKYEAYPGPLVEAEYLYDAYAERDNIPLSSSRNDKRYKKKKKHKRLDSRGSYIAEPSNEHGIARDAPSGSARYADMAPKHWEEFPAGGPPHYQRAPTEYERPPPYYYPGTEQQ